MADVSDMPNKHKVWCIGLCNSSAAHLIVCCEQAQQALQLIELQLLAQ